MPIKNFVVAMVAVSSRCFWTLCTRAAGVSVASYTLVYLEGSHEKTTTRERWIRLNNLHNVWTQQRTSCEAIERKEKDSGAARSLAEEDDGFPDFSRHGGRSLLKKYLTKKVYNELKDRRTALGVTLEDIIRGGVSLPGGAHPPRGVGGIYAGDAESYHMFAPLLDPLIQEHHMASYRRRLGRHQTNLNPQELLGHRLDPDGDYVLFTRMRLARSIKGFRFCPCITRAERRHVEILVRECLTALKTGKYVPVVQMTNSQHDDLIQRRILFPDPDDYSCSAGTHRDWPDARGIYCDDWDDTPSLIVWCNYEDHLAIISNAKGGDVQGVFATLSKAVWALEDALREQGHCYEWDNRYGYLNSSPGKIGTGLRASVYLKLVQLGRHPEFENIIRRLRLEARSEHSHHDKRYTGIFDIANSQSLGKSEVELINVMIQGVDKLIMLEKQLESGEEIDLESITE